MPYADFARPLWRRIFATREMAIVGVLIAVIIVASIMVPKFYGQQTLYYLLMDIMAILMISLPMTCVMITGDIDVSVGSMLGLSCSLTGLLTSLGVPFELTMIIAVLVGLAGGLLNGLLVTRIALPALAVTIGTMALFRGIAVGLLGTKSITTFPKMWTDLAKARIPGTGIPWPILVFLILTAAFVVLLHYTSFGRGIYAIGLNREAAAFSGVSVGRTRLILFVLAGGTAALGGIYYTLRFGTARGDVGDGLELQVIAAVVLGGVSVFGGRGAIYGGVAGVILIGVLSSALRLVGVTADVIKIITGVLLILSVLVAALLNWVQARRAARLVASSL
jgi:rhamnose transport system permease protein